MSGTYKAGCACGAVEVEVSGDPFFVGYCHCRDCRAWMGAPVIGVTIWPRDTLKITKGADHLLTYKRTEGTHRKSCTKCGGAVFVDIPDGGIVDVLAGALKDFSFTPTAHTHYQQRMITMQDDLPKFADMPAEFGGSGDLVAE